jgi:hypothetical protein
MDLLSNNGFSGRIPFTDSDQVRNVKQITSRREEKLNQNGKALEFVSQNGEELIRNIFFNVHNVIAASSDYFWDILKNTHQDQLFEDEDRAFLVLLTTFISIRVEMEMQTIYEEYGNDVYEKAGEYVLSYYQSFLVNFAENVEEFAVFLMNNAHETIISNEGKTSDILLALQFRKIAGTDMEISPSAFHPLMPALSEGVNLADVIENNI